VFSLTDCLRLFELLRFLVLVLDQPDPIRISVLTFAWPESLALLPRRVNRKSLWPLCDGSAARFGRNVVGEYVDIGMSGTKEKRPRTRIDLWPMPTAAL
jgi:hypothetical protein